MFTRYFARRGQLAVLGLVLLTLPILASCGKGSHTTSVSSARHSSVITTSAKSGTGTTATATLKHMPYGTATFNWDYTDQMLTVQVMLTGLAPNSTHPEHIHEGSCGSDGEILYPLSDLVADAYGVANATSKVHAPEGIPASGWFIDIHDGPTLSTADEALSIACGDLINHDTSLRSVQVVHVPLELAAATSKGQNASGTAHLSVSGHTLTVQMTLTGMEPDSEHMAHIHSGSCVSQGAVLYSLPVVKADASGKSTIDATFQNVSEIPASGWYINVHRTTDLSTQTGFDPIACGDVVLN
jgi:hypothetical protein